MAATLVGVKKICMRYYARKRVAKKNEYGDSSQAIEEYEKKCEKILQKFR